MPTLASTRPYVYFLLFCSQTYSNPPFQCKTCEWLDHARSNCSSTCVMSVHALWHAGIFVCLCVCVCVCVCLCVCPLCYWLFVAHFDSRHFSTNNQCFHCACSDSSSACVVKSHLIYTCAMSIHVSNPNRHDQTCITSKHVQCPCMCQIQINMSKHVSHSNMCNVQACVKSKQVPCLNMGHIVISIHASYHHAGIRMYPLLLDAHFFAPFHRDIAHLSGFKGASKGAIQNLLNTWALTYLSKTDQVIP